MASEFAAGNYRFIPAVFQYSSGAQANAFRVRPWERPGEAAIDPSNLRCRELRRFGIDDD